MKGLVISIAAIVLAGILTAALVSYLFGTQTDDSQVIP